MLALAVAASIAALAWPALTGATKRQRLRRAADEIRTAFTDARIQAIEEERTLAFRFLVEGNRYKLSTWNDGVTSIDPAAGQTANSDTSAPSQTSTLREETLPESILFHSGEKQSSGRDLARESAMDHEYSIDEQWSTPLFFYADGTTSSGQVYLKIDQDADEEQAIKVELRGLTGVSTISRIDAVTELSQ